MDEYDELFEIEDNFEDQFADELEVLAQMDGEGSQAKKTFYVTWKSHCLVALVSNVSLCPLYQINGSNLHNAWVTLHLLWYASKFCITV